MRASPIVEKSSVQTIRYIQYSPWMPFPKLYRPPYVNEDPGMLLSLHVRIWISSFSTIHLARLFVHMRRKSYDISSQSIVNITNLILSGLELLETLYNFKTLDDDIFYRLDFIAC